MKTGIYAQKPNSRDRLLLKGRVLAEFLNRADGTAKVLSLVKEYGMLQGLLPKIVAGRPSGRVVSGPYEGAFVYPGTKAAARSVKKLNRLLAGYHFRQIVQHPVLVRRGETAPIIETRTHPYRDSPRVNEEYDAVECVIALATAGEITRLKQCPGCPLWFMAARPDQEHCSGTCKAKCWRKSHRKKTAWAKYMRGYRRLIASKNVK
jgi:hypothetical protein